MTNLTKNVKVTRVLTSQVAGTSDTLSTSIIDMAGFEGVMFVAELGDVTNTAVLTLQAQQNTANSTSGMATLSGTSAQAAYDTTSGDNKVLILDIYRPLERYLRAQLVRATANLVIDSVLAIQYGSRVAPTTHDSTTVKSSVALASPDEA